MFLLNPRCFKPSHFHFSLFHTHTAIPSVPNPSKLPPYSLLADTCTSMNQLKQIHAQMIVSTRIHDNYAASRIMSFCALSEMGDLKYALKLFRYTPDPNSFMWNTLIRAQASTSNPSEAIHVYIKMRRLGVMPGKHTFPFVLKACANYNSIASAKQIHAHVIMFGLELELYSANGLVRCYSVGGNMDDARKLFDEMPERGLIIWTSIVSGYAQNFQSNEALVLFEQMVSEGIEANDATLASVLSACARSGCLIVGKQIHEFVKEKGIKVGLILGTALVDMYSKNGAILDARKLFDEMRIRNTATWNAIICGLAAHGHAKEALELFCEMAGEKVPPNDITFVGVLSACCHAGLVDLGRDIFHSMKREHGIDPKIEHYGCLVDLLGRGGWLVEAEELMNSMAWKADIVILGALLAACKSHGNIKIAERVVEKMLDLEPDNHGVYIVLSNMYADAGRWEDVVKLRKSMKDGDLKKVPGWSSVDGRR